MAYVVAQLSKTDSELGLLAPIKMIQKLAPMFLTNAKNKDLTTLDQSCQEDTDQYYKHALKRTSQSVNINRELSARGNVW